MGMQQRVVLGGRRPSWQAMRETLGKHFGIAPEMRMIDGEIALPAEEPPDHWKELRVAAGDGAGMVTLQYDNENQVDLVVWGNADHNLQQIWHQLTWCLAHLADGMVETDDGRYTAEDFGARLLGFG